MSETHQPPAARLSGIGHLLNPLLWATAARELVRLVVRQRWLTLEIAKRELVSEHRGKALGMFWGIFQPLFLLLVYMVIYGVVFNVRIGGTFELPRNFTIYLLSGLVPWFAFGFSMSKSVGVITGNANLVKQVVFDLSLLPIASSLAASMSLVLGLGFVAILTALTYGSLPLTYLLVPLLVFSQILAMAGVAFFLAACGTFLRDVRDLVQLSMVLLIFLLPIVYLPSQVPSAFNPILWLNPFTYMVYCYQDALYYGRFEHVLSWFAFPLGSVIVCIAGYRFFRRLRPLFANVL